MTELETLATELEQAISEQWHVKEYRLTYPIMRALITAYQLGRALTPAQLAARKRNAQKAGRKAGSKDSQPRTRRTRAELEAARKQTQDTTP